VDLYPAVGAPAPPAGIAGVLRRRAERAPGGDGKTTSTARSRPARLRPCSTVDGTVTRLSALRADVTVRNLTGLLNASRHTSVSNSSKRMQILELESRQLGVALADARRRESIDTERTG
jgi:hypothetical protein